METETSRAASHDGDLALEGEEGREIVEIYVGHDRRSGDKTRLQLYFTSNQPKEIGNFLDLRRGNRSRYGGS